MKTRIFELSALFAFAIAVIASIAGFENDCSNIRHEVLRLHVIANSDSPEDQRLKLQVRDKILETGREIFSESGSISDAEEKIADNIQILEQTARDVIRQNGFDYPVRVELAESLFPTKTYESIALPAGKYSAVRVLIGCAEGKNWWCVMFPPLCLPSAASKTELSDVLSHGGLEITQSDPKYEVRFWIIEKLSELKNRD